MFLARILIPAGKPIVGIGIVITTASSFSSPSGNRFCLYSDTGALAATTPVDDTLWTATGWRT